MTDSITGGCYCGQIRYRATPPIHYQANCHCENCRRAIGAQAVAWITVSSSNFNYTNGEPKTYRTETDATRYFCPNCGSSLAYTHPSRTEHVDIATASLDHPENYPPDHDVFPEEKLSWTPLCDTKDSTR